MSAVSLIVLAVLAQSLSRFCKLGNRKSKISRCATRPDSSAPA